MRQRAGNKLRSALNIGTLGQNHVFRDVVGGKEKSDFYSFRLGYSSNFSLRLDRLKANANVMLMNGQGKMMMQSKRPKQKPEAISTVLGAGTYYVRVYPAKRKDKTRYQLQLSAVKIPRPPEPPPVILDNHSSNPTPTQPPKNDGGKTVTVPTGGSVSPTGGSAETVSPALGRNIRGTFGNDTLKGGAGNDVIEGYNGIDILTGGGGADRFFLRDDITPYYLGSGYAVITDFNLTQGDRIEVTNNIFYPLSGYRLVYDRFFLSNAFGQSFDIGTAAMDTAIYWNNDLLAIVQDAVVS
ncbi:hypothetical protein C7B61_12750 [filamentous cyanobacterium CCP1]|nr:hypothetical protein C7B76_04985 [filamentous cyanobacterium CCP2]PSB63961.1 hypothetical protein C7B61_12750 [filamentous cyanobacterium CCP1]